MGKKNLVGAVLSTAFLMASGLMAETVAQSNGLYGEYYNNTASGTPQPPPGSPAGTTFTGAPVLTRIDNTVNFGFATPPGPGVTQDQFMIAWTGNVVIQTAGNYTFRTRIDDGSRLWIDGTIRIDSWSDKAPTDVDSALFSLAAGSHTLRLEFYENGGGEECRLSYNGPDSGNAWQIIPNNRLTPPPPPPVPTGVTATAATDPQSGQPTVTVTWNQSNGATSYNILRGVNGASPTPFATVQGGATTTYVDSQVAVNNDYCYVVQAANGIFVSASSSPPACARPLPIPPRTNDHEEGLFGTDCGCGSVGSRPPWLLALAGALLALTPFRPRKFKLERSA